MTDRKNQFNSEIPRGYKVVPESKSAQISLIVKPSTKETLKQIADDAGLKVNGLINCILDDYVESYYKSETMDVNEVQSDKIESAIEMIDDALQKLIKNGMRLVDLEGSIRMEMGTVFNRAFKTECEMIQEGREK